MSNLESPPGQESGEAARFLRDIGIVWDFFASYETSEPLVVLEFDDGRHGSIGDLPNAPKDLLRCLAAFHELPTANSLHATATPCRMEESPFDLEISYAGIDGPLTITFDDGTLLFAHVESMEAEQPLSRWAAGVASGIAQQQIEAVVSLARLAELPDALPGVDQPVAEALLSMLGNLAATEEPPKTVVRAAAGWLAHKLDVFVEEAVKTAGKTAGVVGVGGAALLVQKHAPGLADQLHKLVDLAT